MASGTAFIFVVLNVLYVPCPCDVWHKSTDFGFFSIYEFHFITNCPVGMILQFCKSETVGHREKHVEI